MKRLCSILSERTDKTYHDWLSDVFNQLLQNKPQGEIRHKLLDKIDHPNMLPCPFCNGEVKVIRLSMGYYAGQETEARCQTCGMTFNYVEQGYWDRVHRVPGRLSFIDLWNRRVK